MKTLVYLAFLALCLFAVVGWFLDWYTVVELEAGPGRHRVQIEFDAGKIREDFARGSAKLQQSLRRVHERGEGAPVPAPVSPAPVEIRGER